MYQKLSYWTLCPTAGYLEITNTPNIMFQQGYIDFFLFNPA